MNDETLKKANKLRETVSVNTSIVEKLNELYKNKEYHAISVRISSNMQAVVPVLTDIETELILTMVKTFSEKRLTQLTKEFEAL